MGWAHSPPYFCAFTENGYQCSKHFPSTSLAPTASSGAVPATTAGPTTETICVSINLHLQHCLPPLATIDVYLDDFMALAQPPIQTQTMCSLLHSVGPIFYDTPISTTCRPIILEKKIEKGDATWSMQKTLLS
jgi:hypothetical protein